MSETIQFEQIDPDPYSGLTQQAAALKIRDLYHPTTEIEPGWQEIDEQIGIMDGLGTHYVVHEAGVVLGVIAAREAEGDATRVYQLVVNRHQRHQGYGRALICGVARVAAERGNNVIELTSSPEAHDFYVRLGFIALDPRAPNALKADVGDLVHMCDEAEDA